MLNRKDKTQGLPEMINENIPTAYQALQAVGNIELQVRTQSGELPDSRMFDLPELLLDCFTSYHQLVLHDRTSSISPENLELLQKIIRQIQHSAGTKTLPLWQVIANNEDGSLVDVLSAVHDIPAENIIQDSTRYTAVPLWLTYNAYRELQQFYPLLRTQIFLNPLGYAVPSEVGTRWDKLCSIVHTTEDLISDTEIQETDQLLDTQTGDILQMMQSMWNVVEGAGVGSISYHEQVHCAMSKAMSQPVGSDVLMQLAALSTSYMHLACAPDQRIHYFRSMKGFLTQWICNRMIGNSASVYADIIKTDITHNETFVSDNFTDKLLQCRAGNLPAGECVTGSFLDSLRISRIFKGLSQDEFLLKR